jgi:hypothetical protein
MGFIQKTLRNGLKMGKSAPAAPAAPDPAATAAAQGAINKETAVAQSRLNQVDEYTPYGQSIYTPKGEEIDGIQQFRRDTTLNPEQQAIVDQQTAISGDLNRFAGDQIGRVEQSLSTPFSYEGMPDPANASPEARQEAIDALYGQYQSRLDPRFAKEQSALETRLANQGIGIDSDAYRSATSEFGRNKNDAYTSAANQAVVGGGAEQSRLFGLQNSARERAIQEQAYLRGIPLNEMSALMGASGGVNMPTFSPTPQTGVQTADITSPTMMQYGGQMNAYNQGRSSNNAMMGGLFGLAGSIGGGLAGNSGLFSGSDRRIKENISVVGKLDNGLPVYSFRYKSGGPQQIGLMAQDVEKVNPDAVMEINGIKAVNYSEAVL